jgi:hypothetical protein
MGEAGFSNPFNPPVAVCVWSDDATALPKLELKSGQWPRLFHPQGLVKHKNHV